MRRPLVAIAAAISLVTAPAPVVADDADPDVSTTPAGPVMPDTGAPGPVLEVDQRFGLVEAASDLVSGPEAVVEAGALPAPEPGAEVYPRPADGVYDVRGGGFGHGIGMSQYGADGAGRAGLDYQEILDFYYPGTVLETRSTGTIRIGLVSDDDGVTRVDDRPGLVVSSAPGGTTYPLRDGFSQWRVRATGAAASSCTLQGLDAGGTWRAAWPSGMPQSCPVSFSSPTEGTVDLFMPSGQRRVYRGTLTATHHGSAALTTVNHLPTQQYLRSVTMAEMPVYFHAQALRAQAVAARTYALRGANGTDYYDTCDTTACQAYRGAGLRNGDGSITRYEHPNTDAAVQDTDGQVLTYDFGGGRRTLATTMYSSSDGGHTTTGGSGHGYLTAQPDPYDAVGINPRHAWAADLPVSKLEARYGIHRVERVQILRRDGHGRWGGRVLDARVEGFTAAGEYTWAYASGAGLQLSNPWPANAAGLSSNYFTILQDGRVERIAGNDRYETAAEASRSWGSGTPVVYVVGGEDYPDALTGAARAGVYDAPVLLTRRAIVPTATRLALDRLAPGRIVVVGGTAAVSPEVVEQLRGYATSGDLTRVAGSNRYETAANLASYYPTDRPRVYLASGEDFPDALAGAALAADEQMPMLLTRNDRLGAPTVRQLQRLNPGEIVVLGGSAAVSDEVVSQLARYTTSGTVRRLAGADRYATMAQVAAEFPPGRSPAYVASGHQFADAVVGAALAGGLRGVPVLLTTKARLHAQTGTALDRQRPGSVLVLGGSGAVADGVLGQVASHLR